MVQTSAATAVAEFNQKVDELVARGVNRRMAVMLTWKADPELHRWFLKETNRGKPSVQAAIDVHFDGLAADRAKRGRRSTG